MARKEKKIHYIYKTTCNVTGKWYIGMHSTTKLDDGYLGSGKILRYSIRKHGKDNHTKEILEFLETREKLMFREQEIVNKELISDGKCMNLKEGGTGGGGFWSKEHSVKCHLGASNWQKKNWCDSKFREKIELVLLENVKKAHIEGKIKYDNFKGKKHSEETKKLMSESSKNIGIGEKNSQYGTCWITKDNVNKKIKKENLEFYLNESWVKGRK